MSEIKVTEMTEATQINLSGTLRLDIMNQGSDSGFSVKPFKCIIEYTKTTD